MKRHIANMGRKKVTCYTKVTQYVTLKNIEVSILLYTYVTKLQNYYKLICIYIYNVYVYTCIYVYMPIYVYIYRNHFVTVTCNQKRGKASAGA